MACAAQARCQAHVIIVAKLHQNLHSALHFVQKSDNGASKIHAKAIKQERNKV